MGQEKSTPRLASTRFVSPKHSQSSLLTLEHESFLKLRKTPFKNSIRISDSPPLFLENLDTTLAKLLSQRFGGTRLFTEEDIIKLVQTCLYGLAYMQNNGIAYKDLTTDNIYYDMDEGVFKLLPHDLVEESSYEIVITGKKFRNLPPELILALRMEEEDLEEDLLYRANIFMLGMILLEVCTLKSSSQCYDDDNFDILDKAIQERLGMVKQFYPTKIAELISVMLEYDYTKRLTAEQLSTFVNQEITLERNKKKQVPLSKSTVRVKEDEMTRFQQNYQNQEPLQNITQYRNYEPAIQQTFNKQKSKQYNHPQYNHNPYNQQSHHNQHNQHNQQNNPTTYEQYHQYTPKRKPSPQHIEHSPYQKKPTRQQSPLPYRRSTPPPPPPPAYHQMQRLNCRKQAMGGTKYPSIIYQTDFSSKQNKDDSTEFSLCRIKEEIERSRKRIQEFNRLEPVGRFGR